MDFKQIQDIIKGFESSNITSLELEMDSLKLKLNKTITAEGEVVVENKGSQSVPVKQEVQQTQEEQVDGHGVKSPLVGTYYEASSPDDEPYVQVGQKVNKGDTLCIIEAMKIMNEITAPVSGTVSEINIKNGEVVSFDQTIMTIV